MKTITICGSMRFESEMQKIAFLLEANHGFNALQCVYGLRKGDLSPAQTDMLEKAHRKRIALSDAIYVADIDGIIGDTTREEIRYAAEMGKEILYHSKFAL